MKKIAFGIFMLFGFLSFAQDLENCGIILHGDQSIILKTPKGWVLDCDSGNSMGIPVVFYKEGEKWQSAETVMYINFASLEIEDQTTLEELMSYDEEQFKKNYKGIEVKKIDDFRLENYKGVVKYFGKGAYESHEYLAYLDLKKFAIMVVVTSRSESGLKENSSTYLELLNSIKVLSVKTKK